MHFLLLGKTKGYVIKFSDICAISLLHFEVAILSIDYELNREPQRLIMKSYD